MALDFENKIYDRIDFRENPPLKGDYETAGLSTAICQILISQALNSLIANSSVAI